MTRGNQRWAGEGIGHGLSDVEARVEKRWASRDVLKGGKMPTKKESTPREREIARKKNHPRTKTAPPIVAQNGEKQPKEG
jgi:hypothetical protein